MVSKNEIRGKNVFLTRLKSVCGWLIEHKRGSENSLKSKHIRKE